MHLNILPLWWCPHDYFSPLLLLKLNVTFEMQIWDGKKESNAWTFHFSPKLLPLYFPLSHWNRRPVETANQTLSKVPIIYLQCDWFTSRQTQIEGKQLGQARIQWESSRQDGSLSRQARCQWETGRHAPALGLCAALSGSRADRPVWSPPEPLELP